MINDELILGDHNFESRLILGTGKFSSPKIMKQAIETSETNMVTVAVRRVDLENKLFGVWCPCFDV